MTEVAIQANALQKSFKETHVLKGVDFAVRRGEIFALLGSNGAGKTTTINILSTLLPPDVGEHARISLTGQFAAVDAILTRRENLVLMAQLRGGHHLQ